MIDAQTISQKVEAYDRMAKQFTLRVTPSNFNQLQNHTRPFTRSHFVQHAIMAFLSQDPFPLIEVREYHATDPQITISMYPQLLENFMLILPLYPKLTASKLVNGILTWIFTKDPLAYTLPLKVITMSIIIPTLNMWNHYGFSKAVSAALFIYHLHGCPPLPSVLLLPTPKKSRSVTMTPDELMMVDQLPLAIPRGDKISYILEWVYPRCHDFTTKDITAPTIPAQGINVGFPNDVIELMKQFIASNVRYNSMFSTVNLRNWVKHRYMGDVFPYSSNVLLGYIKNNYTLIPVPKAANGAKSAQQYYRVTPKVISNE